MKIHFLHLLALNCLQYPVLSQSAEILGIFPVFSRSHLLFNQPIVEGLAAKGHNVTVISYFKTKDNAPNYREILLEKSHEGFQDWVDSTPIEDKQVNGLSSTLRFFAVEKSSCNKVFALEYVKRLIASKEKTIDLIIAEVFHTRCFHLLAHKLNASLILTSQTIPQMGVEYFIGNPFYPAFTPAIFHAFPLKMNFMQRLLNTFQYLVLYWHLLYMNDMAQFARRVFDMELPSDEELNGRAALAFYNDHFSLTSRPKSSNLIDVSGMHIKEAKELPEDIKDFIEGAPHGVILFSFGTSVKASSIPEEKLRIIMNAFASIPQRVLWRVNEMNMTGVPPNVKLATWVPQRDVLEHKNVIAFISHCGIMGLLEATYSATPVIAVPLLVDQFQNTNILVAKKVAVYVDYSVMDENIFAGAIKEITTNTKYRENMQTLSKIFKDRPRHPLEEALYWTEYVLKYQRGPNLRMQGADMPLYQFLLFDVVVFVSGVILGLIVLLKCLFKIIFLFIYQWRRKKIDLMKNQAKKN